MAHISHYQLFINGKNIDSIKGFKFQSINPATKEVIGLVADGTSEDIDVAVYAAKNCLNSANWGYASTGKERAIVLRKIGEIMLSRLDELARLESLDQGKPFRDALKCVKMAAGAFHYYATLSEDLDLKQNEIIDSGLGGDFLTTIMYDPIGVVGILLSLITIIICSITVSIFSLSLYIIYIIIKT